MALIYCPECGTQVSDKAKTCIHCGSPLTSDKKVKIKIPRFVTGMLSQNAANAEVYIHDKCVWKGVSGQVAIFEIDDLTLISVRIIKAYTGHPFPFFKTFDINGRVLPAHKYEIKNAKTSLVFGDPSKSEYIFSEVDVIDSGI